MSSSGQPQVGGGSGVGRWEPAGSLALASARVDGIACCQRWRRWAVLAAWVVGGWVGVAGWGGNAADLPVFDFTEPAGGQGWTAVHDLAPVALSREGLELRITGSDPYVHGPARDYPENRLLWLRLRLHSEEGGGGQVFFFTDQATEERSVRFAVAGGRWEEIRLPLPALGAGCRLRVDPPGGGGRCVLERLWLEERPVWTPPVWPRPEVPELGRDPLVVRAGELRLVHSRTEVGGWRIEVAGEEVAIGWNRPQLAYRVAGGLRWVPFGWGMGSEVMGRQGSGGVEVSARWRDPEGATWTFRQEFTSAGRGAIRVEGVLRVDGDREVAYVPLLTVFPGAGSYGTNKNQALLAGLEYLENEPSSSEADVIGPDAWRLVPDSMKITFPLMAIQAREHYLGLTWEPQPHLAAVHDSPDRQFHSGGHLMGLLMPGSDGANREERSLLPYDVMVLKAGEAWRVRATLLGGRGATVVSAVQEYVRRHGWPAAPWAGVGVADHLELAARGWLESRIREGDRYRHAVWPGFPAQPAADAAVWMEWLAGRMPDIELGVRLRRAAAAALGEIAPEDYNRRQVGHHRRPLPALVFGAVRANVEQAAAEGRELLRRFQADGTVRYEPGAGGVDYGRTHWSREANGLTAQVVAALLEAGMFSGDGGLLEAGVQRLRGLDKFRGTVPRGAQTWEVPLHTPDLLASAHLVRAYTMGYELTGEGSFLESARYWAWTGVPFVYLRSPTVGGVGVYSTIPVLGATGWKAPVWLGCPVQWCGLVYADALYQLQAHDARGPWGTLAGGIVAAGWQHTWSRDDVERCGLLPDYFLLRPQRREGPAINPATLLLPSLAAFGEAAAYTRQVVRSCGWIVHAPGGLSDLRERGAGVSFRVHPWSAGPSWLLINGVRSMPRVRMDGHVVALTSPHAYDALAGLLLVRLEGEVLVVVER